MKKTKKIMCLLSILLLTFLLYGCNNNSSSIDNNISASNISESLENKGNSDNNLVTEEEIWNEASIIAKDITKSYGENTIEGLQVVSDKASEDAKNTTKYIDDNLLKTTESKIRESYNEDASVEGLYKILYVDAFIKDKLFADYLTIVKDLNDEQEKKKAFENYHEIAKPYEELYSPIIQSLRREDIKNKY